MKVDKYYIESLDYLDLMNVGFLRMMMVFIVIQFRSKRKVSYDVDDVGQNIFDEFDVGYSYI